MKYCLPFLINSQYKDTIDELYIQVYETSDILKLPAFLEQHQQQRVIIVIEDFEIITKDKFKMIASNMCEYLNRKNNYNDLIKYLSTDIKNNSKY